MFPRKHKGDRHTSPSLASYIQAMTRKLSGENPLPHEITKIVSYPILQGKAKKYPINSFI